MNQWKITIGRPHLDTFNTNGSSITWRLLRQNSVQPQEKTMYEILEGYKKQPVPDVLNQKFTSPTSLPLYFYFGYQLLKESHLMQKCGHVRQTSNQYVKNVIFDYITDDNVNLFSFLSFFLYIFFSQDSLVGSFKDQPM